MFLEYLTKTTSWMIYWLTIEWFYLFISSSIYIYKHQALHSDWWSFILNQSNLTPTMTNNDHVYGFFGILLKEQKEELCPILIFFTCSLTCYISAQLYKLVQETDLYNEVWMQWHSLFILFIFGLRIENQRKHLLKPIDTPIHHHHHQYTLLATQHVQKKTCLKRKQWTVFQE